MIEKKINKGQYLNFGAIAEVKGAGAEPGLVSSGCENRSITVSTREHWYSAKKREVQAGHGDKSQRNFIWLPYVPGAINYTESTGLDVLSAKFTGCYMIAFTDNGARRVCHVATPEAKAAWNAYAARPEVQILAGFKPTDHVDTKINGTTDTGLECLGLITATNTLIAITAWRQKAGEHFRIAAVKTVPSLPLDTLKALP